VELSDRNQTLEEKKKRIMELKKKIQELEKFKFVLNYKIKELKREIGPSSIQILKLNEQVSKMKSELKHFDRVNKNLVLIVEDMRMRQEGLKKSLSVMTKRLSEQEAEKRRVEDNVVDVFTHGISDFKKL
jgi:chromosome segregation ATPase